MTVTTATGEQRLRPKSGRKPLQPVNSLLTTPTSAKSKTKEKQEWKDQEQNQNQIPVVGDLNKDKENHLVTKMESLDASLAEELSAIRKKLERLRLDKEKTERMLNERDMMLDMQMKELQYRGETQKMLELEVDRLYRLKELKSYCMRISSIRSLREKAQEKKINPTANSLSLDFDSGDDEESVGENSLQSPCSSPLGIVAEKEK